MASGNLTVCELDIWVWGVNWLMIDVDARQLSPKSGFNSTALEATLIWGA